MTPEIMLHIAEQADLRMVLGLMCSSSTLHKLISTYECSICKTQLENLPIRPRLTIPGVVLSSSSPTRVILRASSFPGMQELTMRSRRVEALFSPGSILRDVVESQPANQLLPREELASMITGLKRAAVTVDRLADAIADIGRQHVLSGGGGPAAASFDLAGLLRRQRREQLELVFNELSKVDLVFLWLLADYAGMAYMQVWAGAESDPDPWSRIAAFKEAFLHEGSMVLWAWFRPTECPADVDKIVNKMRARESSTGTARLIRYTEAAINHFRTVLEGWEEGPRAREETDFDDDTLKLPGLYMSLRDAFAKHAGIAKPSEDSDEPDPIAPEMNWAMLWEIRRMNGGMHG